MKKWILLLLPLLLLAALTACKRQVAAPDPNVEYYTCTMHPSVHSQDPNGKCPICAMRLVPVFKKRLPTTNNSNATVSNAVPLQRKELSETSEFIVSPERQQMIGVTYAKITRKSVHQNIRAVGTVTYDKQRHWDFVSRVEGYIQKLQVFSRGEVVQEGQPLLTIYSPDLLTAQSEFLGALRAREEAAHSGQTATSSSVDALLESAKRRLRLWNITDQQIAEMEKSGKAADTLTLHSPFKGVVQSLQVDQGRRVMLGEHLVEIVDLSLVWVWGEFYQDELPLLKTGLTVAITSSSYPGETFRGSIALIDPFLDEAKRTGRIRIDVPNPDLKLRPEMFVDVEVEIPSGEALVIPVSAVLPTGNRFLTFLDKGQGRIEPRFLQLGRKVADDYIINAGLDEGETVIASANFLIDAESKVQGAVKSFSEPPAAALAEPAKAPQHQH
jgi:Cu(I)/Ag(I) efflux system membrane fusion protein